MTDHNCRGAVRASAREVECRTHGARFVPKSVLVAAADGVEGTVIVCPVCVALARAQVRKMKALSPRSFHGPAT